MRPYVQYAVTIHLRSSPHSNVVHRPYARIADVLSVNVGLELLDIVPGRVSTEVDAHLSYDTQKTVDKVGILCLSRLTVKKPYSTEPIEAVIDRNHHHGVCNKDLTALHRMPSSGNLPSKAAKHLPWFLGTKAGGPVPQEGL